MINLLSRVCCEFYRYPEIAIIVTPNLKTCLLQTLLNRTMEVKTESDRSKYKGIFGSPEEPFFNDKNYGVAPDILKEWLIGLNLRNKNIIEKADLKQDYFYHSDATCFIFKTCEIFKLPNNVKYHAAELFERFMLKHVLDLYQYIRIHEPEKKLVKWEEIMGRIQNQALLRIISCCQISSKVVSHYRCISVAKARNYLKDINLKYSPTSIVHSEIRILKTLDYKVMSTTPIIYLETILEIIGYNDPNLNVKPYHAVAVKVMDVVYLKKREIYAELFRVLSTHKTPAFQEMPSFYALKTDQILLAVSVLSAAVYISDRSNTDMIIEQLHLITRRTSEDILDFATVIVHSVMEGGGGDVPYLKYRV